MVFAVPSEPSSIQVMSDSPHSLLVMWNKPVQINGILDHYTVYWYNGQDLISSQTTGQEQSYTIIGLEACMSYNVRNTATTGAGEGNEVEETNTTQTEGKCLQRYGSNFSNTKIFLGPILIIELPTVNHFIVSTSLLVISYHST